MNLQAEKWKEWNVRNEIWGPSSVEGLWRNCTVAGPSGLKGLWRVFSGVKPSGVGGSREVLLLRYRLLGVEGHWKDSTVPQWTLFMLIFLWCAVNYIICHKVNLLIVSLFVNILTFWFLVTEKKLPEAISVQMSHVYQSETISVQMSHVCKVEYETKVIDFLRLVSSDH